MVTFTIPGVYVQDLSASARIISAVPMHAAVFIGQTRHADTQHQATPITNYAEFAQRFGIFNTDIRATRKTGTDYLTYAVQGFFENGGRKLHVLPLEDPGLTGYDKALQRVDDLPDATLVVLPGYSTLPAAEYARLNQILTGYAQTWRKRMVFIEPPPGADLVALRAIRRTLDSSYAAMYTPWLKMHDKSLRRDIFVPPGGHIAGLYAHTELTRGIHKSPANLPLLGITGFERAITEQEQAQLNPEGINALRTLQGRHMVWGARTLSSDPEWRYVAVRRYALFIEQSLQEGLQWVVFKPNAEPLWAQVRLSVTNFMLAQWRNGALQGAKPEEAFVVRMDRSTMTQADIDAGRLILEVGIAPLKPADFVVLHIVLLQQTR